MKLSSIMYGTAIAVLLFSCNTEPTIIEYFGCTNPDACNYDPRASLDNGRCDLITCNRVFGCTDDKACNYNPEANTDDNSCDYRYCGCTDPEARNYQEWAKEDNGSCDYRCTKEATIASIDILEAPVEIAQIKFEVLVDGELALRTKNREYTNGTALRFQPEDYEFNREGIGSNSIRFSGEKEGTFTVQIFVNDLLAGSTTYNSCYIVSVAENTSLTRFYHIGGFDCRLLETDCDFYAYIAFREVLL